MKLRSVQVLRAVAVIGVVLCHTEMLPVGAAGVDLFFVISGFILAPAIHQSRPALDFALARVWRIYPLYWLLSAPWFLVAYHFGELTIARTASSLTLWPIYGDLALPYLRMGWTLMFEMLFYAGLTIAIVSGRGRWLVGLFLACLLANLLWPHPLLGYLGFPLIFEFLFGAAISRAARDRSVGILALVAGVVGLAVAPATPFYDWFVASADITAVLRVLYWGLPCALIVYGAVSLEPLFTKWADGPVFIGDASYSIYLVHGAVGLLGVATLPFVMLSLIFGSAVHLGLERRLLALKPSLPRWRVALNSG